MASRVLLLGLSLDDKEEDKSVFLDPSWEKKQCLGNYNTVWKETIGREKNLTFLVAEQVNTKNESVCCREHTTVTMSKRNFLDMAGESYAKIRI